MFAAKLQETSRPLIPLDHSRHTHSLAASPASGTDDDATNRHDGWAPRAAGAFAVVTGAFAVVTGPAPQRLVGPGAMSLTMASNWARLPLSCCQAWQQLKRQATDLGRVQDSALAQCKIIATCLDAGF